MLLNQMDGPVLEDTEKMELLKLFFASVFTAEDGLQESQTLDFETFFLREEIAGAGTV